VLGAVSENRAIGRILEENMKKLALAAAISLAATSAFAGSVAPPKMEPAVVAQDTSSSSSGIVIALLVLLVLGAAVANN